MEWPREALSFPTSSTSSPKEEFSSTSGLPREYEAGHAPGSRLINPKELIADPFTAVYGDDPLAEPDPHFVLVCDTGFRSGHLVDRVREKGYTCDFLASGLRAWRAGGEILIPGPPRGR